MSQQNLIINNAKVHNLKNLSVTIPKNTFTVITGPSGSGKSSLAFDTIYIEGQRRYIESLSSYARQFLDQFAPADVESIVGLSPTIAIDQRSSARNPRSTAGTVTEIFDYLRVLYARIATPHCTSCHREVEGQSSQKIVQIILKHPEGSKIQILAPVIKNKKGEHREELSKYLSMGLSRARIDGNQVLLSDELALDKKKAHHIDIVVDRIILKEGIRSRLADSVEMALKFSGGTLIVLKDDGTEILFSEKIACPSCDLSFPILEPRLFSFNSPLGACPVCNGLGESQAIDESLLITDGNLSIIDGAIGLLRKKNSFLFQMVRCMAQADKVDLTKPFNSLPARFKKTLISGGEQIYKYSFRSESSYFHFQKAFPGLLDWFAKKYNETLSEKVRAELEGHMNIHLCHACKGNRLNPFALAATIENKSIMDVCNLSIKDASFFFNNLKLTGEKKVIAEKILKEVKNRLGFLLNVGLDYITLNRGSSTLSGGEAQRIRLATQIGSSLSGVLYVLDEPSIGLHQKDNSKLINTLASLRDLGNTILVVEHDQETIESADHILDMGPGAGEAGGRVVAQGTPKQIRQNKNSLTGRYLAGKEKIVVPTVRRSLKTKISVQGACQNNLRKIDVDFPLSGLVCVSGVSGSGKSSLVHDVLLPAVRHRLSKNPRSISKKNFSSITGVDHVQSIIELDQSPIGRTPHSNPATYSGVFDPIRQLFAELPDSKIRGYKPGRFSFNVKGGRCDACEGNGLKKIEMHFLPEVYVECDECHGSRFNSETLTVLYKGKSISDVLNMSISDALDFFKNHERIRRIFETLNDVGLGYIKLGQSATTLSGGEAQRLKLSRELARRPAGHCLYVLDEPTTGLHFHDIRILLAALQKLIDRGHSMLIIEHNLDILKCADYIIDLGPGGGDAGGMVIAKGTPEEVAKNSASFTGEYLKKVLNNYSV